MNKRATQRAYKIMRSWLTRDGLIRAFSEETGQCMYVVPTEDRELEVDIAEDGTPIMLFVKGLPPDALGRPQKCSVGCCLSEEALGAVGHSEEGVLGIIENALVARDLEGVDRKFLTKVQEVHDSETYWSDDFTVFRVEALDKVAAEFGLTVLDS